MGNDPVDVIEEVRSKLGTELGFSSWITITQEDVSKFADATRAHEWIHIDPERARREGPFGTTVAHGYLTLSLSTAFITELLDIDESRATGINYGVEHARFPAPVPVGSKVRAHGTLTALESHGDGVKATVRLTCELEGGGKPVCVADVLTLIVPAVP